MADTPRPRRPVIDTGTGIDAPTPDTEVVTQVDTDAFDADVVQVITAGGRAGS